MQQRAVALADRHRAPELVAEDERRRSGRLVLGDPEVVEEGAGANRSRLLVGPGPEVDGRGVPGRLVERLDLGRRTELEVLERGRPLGAGGDEGQGLLGADPKLAGRRTKQLGGMTLSAAAARRCRPRGDRRTASPPPACRCDPGPLRGRRRRRSLRSRGRRRPPAGARPRAPRLRRGRRRAGCRARLSSSRRPAGREGWPRLGPPQRIGRKFSISNGVTWTR